MSKVHVGDTLRIIEMKGEPHYAGREGVVEVIDDIGQLHGTWGGCAVIPEEDQFEIIKKANCKEGMEILKCCFCGKEIDTRQANNAAPLKEGYCCKECNVKVVLPHRLGLLKK